MTADELLAWLLALDEDKLRLRVVFDDTEREECDIDPRVCLSIDSEGETVIKL
jgi:hypothetical protein